MYIFNIFHQYEKKENTPIFHCQCPIPNHPNYKLQGHFQLTFLIMH